MKANFAQFKAACLLVGLNVFLPERKDTKRVWFAGNGGNCRAIAHEVADAYKIPAKNRWPHKKREGYSLLIDISAFDHVPLQRHKMVTKEWVTSSGDKCTYRTRQHI